jgi:phage terminase small subunit
MFDQPDPTKLRILAGSLWAGRGGVCANPCVAIAANARREMRDISALLGRDPASRSRLRVGIRTRNLA